MAAVAGQSAGSAENIRPVVAEMRRAITIHPNRGFVWDSRVVRLSFFTVYFLERERNDNYEEHYFHRRRYRHRHPYDC